MKTLSGYFRVIVVKLSVLVLISEMAIMTSFYFFRVESALLEMVINALLLVVLIVPFLLHWSSQFARLLLEKEEEAILRLNDELKEKVERRTAALRTTWDRLRQSEKMSAVGQLAAGVAHEINNPLGIILGFAQGLTKRLKEDDPMAMPLKSIEREAVRCANLVQDLLVFSRTAKIEDELSDLNETLTGALSLIFARAKTQNVEIVSEMSADLPRIPANRNKLQQALINLANNAIDAMPKGGTLTVGTSLSDRNTGYVEINVRDTGHGIPKEIQARVMEPFFTTKETGKGTGLGLSLVYAIVQKHNGSIELESEEGKGTRFTVFLPIQSRKSGTLPSGPATESQNEKVRPRE